ncbi:glycosyltransferase family 2 protein [Hydrogenivirga sp. 128-5-R1-1]|uniref:glycosyltransferase family 2 protein n=1 Tax=Hydrogenivirga sp. 128-5-R1-1 TaxID=392423 RepID=UPI00015F368F|nr:glycosyltransferase family 2 protein [Hydrogenivirga sp. 128-5-R1-1]EDP76514.1 hypothetical protein HG1285_02868 [Hydrogenivirga sp. 128-5-R1-1]
MAEVSVVIPVYNGERYIKESVGCVLNQTFKDVEVIVVDDASRDRTQDVVYENFGELIGEGKIKYMRNERNMERAFSRNVGFENSSGEYVFFLDHDDLWKENHIEEVLKAFPGYDVVYSFPRSFIDDGSQVFRRSGKRIKPLEETIFSGNIGYPSASAFRRESFPGYNGNFIMREDWEIFIRSYLEGLKIRIVDSDTVLIREHPHRTSRSKLFLEATKAVYEAYKDKVPEECLPHFLLHISDVAFRFGDFRTGYRVFFEAVSKKPSILADRRNLLNFLKRGFRLDRFLGFRA